VVRAQAVGGGMWSVSLCFGCVCIEVCVEAERGGSELGGVVLLLFEGALFR